MEIGAGVTTGEGEGEGEDSDCCLSDEAGAVVVSATGAVGDRELGAVLGVGGDGCPGVATGCGPSDTGAGVG